MSNELERPVKHQKEPEYDYQEVIDYIEKKYNIVTEDYLGAHLNENRGKGLEYQNFWHFVADVCDVDNGKSCYLPWNVYEDPSTPTFAKKIMHLLDIEGFFESNGVEKGFQFYVWW